MTDPTPPAVTSPRIHSIQVSNGGVPKHAVAHARVTTNGIVGDEQRHTKFHGGPQRALCLYALELIETLRHEGHPIEPGSTGENITVVDLDWRTLVPGSRLRLGDEVLIEITSHTVPCKQIKASFADGNFNRISQRHRPGESRLYARVLHEGSIAVDDLVQVITS